MDTCAINLKNYLLLRCSAAQEHISVTFKSEQDDFQKIKYSFSRFKPLNFARILPDVPHARMPMQCLLRGYFPKLLEDHTRLLIPNYLSYEMQIIKLYIY